MHDVSRLQLAARAGGSLVGGDQTPKSPIPIPPIPDLAGKRAGGRESPFPDSAGKRDSRGTEPSLNLKVRHWGSRPELCPFAVLNASGTQLDPRFWQIRRGWRWGLGWTPDPRQIGDGTAIPDPRQIGDGGGNHGDRGFRALSGKIGKEKVGKSGIARHGPCECAAATVTAARGHSEAATRTGGRPRPG
jgi:hypothetical protein